MVPSPATPSSFARPVATAALAAACLLLGGCTLGGSSSVSAQNDELRRTVASQRAEIDALVAARDELSAKLEAASRQANVSPEAVASTPAVSVLEIDSFSTLLPLDAKAPATGVRVHVRTLDGRRRFTQAVGVMTVEVTDAAGTTLAAGRTGPAALRDAYRSSPAGTHYTIESPLTGPASGGAYTLRVRFEDALTGRHLEATRELTR